MDHGEYNKAYHAKSNNITIPIQEIPRLIYHPTTVGTVNAVYALTMAGAVHPCKTLALLNAPFGVAQLSDLEKDHENAVSVICAANSYDQYFRQVRMWARMGFSANQIQEELDVRFESILTILQNVTFNIEVTDSMDRTSSITTTYSGKRRGEKEQTDFKKR